MKKVLFATTAIALSAGTAYADITLTGSGRVGLVYSEDAGDAFGDNGRDVRAENRMRVEFNGSKETDAGVTFGGRIRLQYQSDGGLDLELAPGEGDEDGLRFDRGGATLSAAYIYAEYNGLRVEFGNSNTAMDTVALMYNAEIGYLGQTFGSYSEQGFTAFQSNPYGSGQLRRYGAFAAYSISGFNIKASYVTPDQRTSDSNEEFSMAVDYNFGAITVAGAFALDAGFTDDQDDYFLGAEYAINPDANVGLHLNYTDYSGENLLDALDDDNDDDETTVTLYGNYKFGAITARGYIAHNNDDDNETDIAAGVGADYDLGGATLAGHVARGYDENFQASLGVKFNF